MQLIKKKQVRVLKEKDPTAFEDKYTSIINNFQGDVSSEVVYSEGYFIAIITYEVKEVFEPRTVKDEFNDEGIRYVCGQCPYLEDDGDKRKKRHPCKYAEYGTSRKDSECCEMFYKLLKQGRVVPR